MKRCYIAPAIVFLSFLSLIGPACSKKQHHIAVDFYEEFVKAHKTVPKNDFDIFKNWDLSLRWNGWRRNKNIEKGAILFPKTQQSAFLTFDVISKEKRTLKLSLKSLQPLTQKTSKVLGFFVNGRKTIEFALRNSVYKTIEFDIEEEHFLIGENYLEIRISAAPNKKSEGYWLALKDFQIIESVSSENKSPLPPEELFEAQIEKSFLSKKKIITQRINTSLDYYVFIPENGHLLFDYSFHESPSRANEKKEIFVYLETGSGASEKIFSREIGPDQTKKKTRVDIELSPFQGEIAKLSFCYKGGASEEESKSELVIWEPRLIYEDVRDETKEPDVQRAEINRPFNIMIYLVDCLRPDHLPFYGYSKNTAPFMTEFAEDSIIFGNSYSQSSWTRPSVGALFTGLHPFQHQAITLKSGLSPKLETMAEYLQRAGYFTAGISSNAGIKEYFGFHQGFESFQYHGKQGGGIAEKLNEYIFPQLEEIQTPFFMYIHTMDVHRPYFLKDEFVPPSKNDPIYEDSIRIDISKEKKKREYEVVLDYSIAQYDAAIKQNDKSFGELVQRLKSLNLYEDTMIVLISDHGEEFYEHGKFAHGSSLYQEVIHNVLVVKMPGQIMAGKFIDESIQEIDLLPTILDLTEQPIPSYLAGKTLKDLLISSYVPQTPLHEMMFFEACADLRKKAMIMGKWKIIHTGRQWRDSPFDWELYDLIKDPQEKNDLANVNIVASQYLKKILFSWAQAQEKLKTLGRDDVEKTLTDEDIEEFRALGYIR